jgi:hypothetical protein
MLSERVRLADLLAAVSVATDLGMGQEPEKAIRACLVAAALARRMGTAEAEVSDVYYTALLRHLGCTATAHEEAYLGGDELASRPAAERADFGNPRETVALLLQMGRGTGVDRARYLTRALRLGKKGDRAILGAVCEVGARLAERLGLGPGVRDGLYQSFERWDGKGTPQGLATEDICLPARLAEVAHQAVIFDRLGGPEGAVEMVRRRAGGWFDPSLAATFTRVGAGILDEVGSRDVWEAVVEAEPEPRRTIGTEGLEAWREHWPTWSTSSRRSCSGTPARWPPCRSGPRSRSASAPRRLPTFAGRRYCTTSAGWPSPTGSGRSRPPSP